ncbi:hypothetical protein D9756_006962 [Leucocoprinus leucothites]|uniref:Uncharacterized protein n=1 Tax=Leucocoprinus leucothites TaxID=201217 RepID=A0A8H5D8D9_9AGAR|nr:hypothetical protein D9756_006962 [Leucoagaricus leucothites]
MSTRRPPYTGKERKLVLAFDVGTTYSGISYTVLDPGTEPKIYPVTRFPGRAGAGGDAKVPTVIYYAEDGTICAIGAQTEREGLDALAQESSWIKAEWFKLHLRPKTCSSSSVSDDIPPLPLSKTPVDVFADFLRYMKQCAKAYIEETHLVDGSDFWKSEKEEYIISHPNAWEGAQQTLMRNAAIQAGLVSDTASDRRRIQFVTEGEASLNFCLDRGLTNDSIRRGEGVTIVDAGGGTIDISTYARNPSNENEYKEIAAAQSYFKGSVFVTRAAAKFLDSSQFYDDVAFMTEKFDKSTKLLFRDPKDPQYIKFGNVRDKDLSRGIKWGQLKLEGFAYSFHVVAQFFEPSIQCIVDGVVEQDRLSTQPVKTVFVVGGFAASDYLFSQLEKILRLLGFNVYRPDPHLNKAVPDGSIAGYLRPSVRTRVSRFTYGVRCSRALDFSDEEHARRVSSANLSLRGRLVIPGIFSNILDKHTQVSESQEFRETYCEVAAGKEDLNGHKLTPILCYRGSLSSPRFLDEDSENFHKMFTIHADTSDLIKQAQECQGPFGSYYMLTFDFVILFGLTELKVQLAWTEDGVEKRTPAEVMFDTEIEYKD